MRGVYFNSYYVLAQFLSFSLCFSNFASSLLLSFLSLTLTPARFTTSSLLTDVIRCVCSARGLFCTTMTRRSIDYCSTAFFLPLLPELRMIPGFLNNQGELYGSLIFKDIFGGRYDTGTLRYCSCIFHQLRVNGMHCIGYRIGFWGGGIGKS